MKVDNTKNEMSPILCKHPSIVINFNWWDLFASYGSISLLKHDGTYFFIQYKNYYHLGKDVVYKIIMNTVYLSIETYKHMVITSPRGDWQPLFYAFPCGKCDFCRERKSSEYAFRAACETVIYPIMPLFVTLTYKDQCLPKNGVEKVHLQKFFKRLRARLDYLGYSSDFRYLAVGEYGGKYGRPHYHIILWNYPVTAFPSLDDAFRCIRFAWLYYKKDKYGKRIYHKKKDGRIVPRMGSYGMIKILPVTDGCTSYVTKYFRKAEHNPKKYPNPGFLLTSRGGKSGKAGLGSEYIDFCAESLRKDFDASLSLFEPNLQKEMSYNVCGYIRERVFPSKARLFWKYRDIINDFVYKLKDFIALSKYFSRFKPSILNWTKSKLVLNACKLSKYFLKLRSESDLPDYTQYSRLDYKAHIKVLSNGFISLLNAASLVVREASVISELNRKLSITLARNKYIFEKLSKFEKFYNIPASQYYYDYKHDKYLSKCTF